MDFSLFFFSWYRPQSSFSLSLSLSPFSDKQATQAAEQQQQRKKKYD